tara:strand:+ start:384 stop:539 length:156 start_codon:yes stop_codon:yes gene_type:complete
MLLKEVTKENKLGDSHQLKLGDSHQLKKEIKPLFLLSLRGVSPMLKMVFSA